MSGEETSENLKISKFKSFIPPQIDQSVLGLNHKTMSMPVQKGGIMNPNCVDGQSIGGGTFGYRGSLTIK